MAKGRGTTPQPGPVARGHMDGGNRIAIRADLDDESHVPGGQSSERANRQGPKKLSTNPERGPGWKLSRS